MYYLSWFRRLLIRISTHLRSFLLGKNFRILDTEEHCSLFDVNIMWVNFILILQIIDKTNFNLCRWFCNFLDALLGSTYMGYHSMAPSPYVVIVIFLVIGIYVMYNKSRLKPRTLPDEIENRAFAMIDWKKFLCKIWLWNSRYGIR